MGLLEFSGRFNIEKLKYGKNIGSNYSLNYSFANSLILYFYLKFFQKIQTNNIFYAPGPSTGPLLFPCPGASKAPLG